MCEVINFTNRKNGTLYYLYFLKFCPDVELRNASNETLLRRGHRSGRRGIRTFPLHKIVISQRTNNLSLRFLHVQPFKKKIFYRLLGKRLRRKGLHEPKNISLYAKNMDCPRQYTTVCIGRTLFNL